MPVSAYIQAALFVLLNAVALFAAAGTVEILGFWIYVAIFAGMMAASFAFLDPGLLRERMRPGWPRPRLLPLERRHADVAPRGKSHCAGRRLWAGVLGHAGQPVLLVGGTHPVRPRPACRYGWALSLDTPPGLSRRCRHHRGERPRARLMA